MPLRNTLLLLLSLLISTALHAQTQPVPPELAAKSWLLLEMGSGQALTAEKPEERLEPASLTKLMTAYLSFAALHKSTLNLTQALPVSEKAWRTGGSKMFVKVGDQVPALFAAFDGIVAIVSLGAVVRLIAPHLKNKETDPAIVVIDEAGRFVIPVLSGHLGGANQLAGHLATALGAQAVLTTASDARETLAVDLLGRELGWTFEATHDEIVRCSAAMVNDEAVALVQEAGSTDWWARHANGRNGPLPANLTRFERLEDVPLDRFAAVLWISRREMPAEIASQLAGRRVVYRP